MEVKPAKKPTDQSIRLEFAVWRPEIRLGYVRLGTAGHQTKLTGCLANTGG